MYRIGCYESTPDRPLVPAPPGIMGYSVGPSRALVPQPPGIMGSVDEIETLFGCEGCPSAGLGCSSCPQGRALGQVSTAWYDEWARKLREISDILRNAPRTPQYEPTGYEASTSQESLKAWISSPFTWVAGLTILLLVYKIRTRNA